MTHCPVYSPGEGMRIEVPITKDSLIKSVLMGDNYISLVFNHTDILPINRGWYIVYKGRKWEIMDEVIPESHNSADGYAYELKFYAQQHQMKRSRVFWTQDDIKEATFNLTTTLSTFAELICSNMNAFLGVDYWRVGNIPEELSTKTVALSFDGVACWDAVLNIANLFETEWWVDDDASPASVTLNFGKCLHGEAEQFAEGGVVSKMPIAKRGENADYGTRFYVFGGTRNIPKSYRHTEQGGVTNHISERRLLLPKGRPYIDAVENLAPQDVVEQVVFLNDIYPKNEETITDVQTRVMTADGVSTTVYRIYCSGTAFTPANIIVGETLGATFTSGSLQGREFELSILGGYTNFEKGFEIIIQHENAGGDDEIYIPNEYLHPEVGDKFILTGVELPDRNISTAEIDLLLKGQEIAALRSKDTNTYECPTDSIYCTRHDKNYDIGQRVLLVSSSFGSDGRESRIIGFEKKLYDEYQATYTVGENVKKSRYVQLEGVIVDTKTETKKLIDGTRIQNDRSDFQNLWKVQVVEEGLETLRNDTVAAEADLRASIQSANTKADGAVSDVASQKTQVEANGTALTKLIADDKNMSVREIASDVVAENMPTEVATAMQKMTISAAPAKNTYMANVVYEWLGTPVSLNIQSLTASNASYENVWTIRFGCTTDTSLLITPSVLWKDGVAPRFEAWGVCELRFTKQDALLGGNYLGEWKIYR